MNLYEIFTGLMGESYQRAYAWAKSYKHARELYEQKNPNHKIESIELLLCDNSEPFCTEVSDNGWSR